jgi:hypothetical protein
MTPYAFTGNNPVMLVDPDGRDIWELNPSGEVIKRTKNEEIDQFVIIDNEGNRLEGETYEYGTITQRKGHTDSKGRDITFFEVDGDQNASEIFQFLGDNYTAESDMPVEFTHARVGADNSGRNIIGTIHEPNKTSVGHYLRETGYTLRRVDHNHPNKSFPSQRDIDNAALYEGHSPGVELIVYIQGYGYEPYDSSTPYLPIIAPKTKELNTIDVIRPK